MHKRGVRPHSLADATLRPYRRPPRMSALDGWIDVCRAGTWHDTHGREVALDEARLDRIVAAHASADPAPVVVGHPETDAPAFAWIDGLRRSGDRLQATLRDVAPAFREAVEAGRYAGRSIALQGDRLRHLGFLGGRAPAVPGLAPTQFAAAPDTVIAFADMAALASPVERAAFGAMARIARGWRENIIARDGIEAADAAIPDWDIDTVAEAAEPPAETDAARPIMAAPETMPAAETDNPADNGREGAVPPETSESDEAALAARETALAAREAALAATERLATADAALQPHIEAGRVLPAERAGLAALLASLPEGDDETLTFAAPGGNGEVREAPRAIFERHLAALPKRVEFDTLAGGAIPPSAAPDSGFVAPADATVDPASLAVHNRAVALAAERDIPYVEAAAIAARGD